MTDDLPTDRPRVVVVVAQLPPETGHLRLLAEQFAVTVYASEGPGRRQQQGAVAGASVRTMRAVGAFSAVRWIYLGMGRALREDAPDVVHVVSEPWGLLAVQAALHARLHPSRRLIVHGCDRLWWHGSLPEQWGKRVLAAFTLRRADAFCAETNAAFGIAHDAGLRAEAPTVPIHTHPRSPESFRPAASAQERAAARRAVGVPEQGLGVGFVGRLVPQKGPQLLVDAWQRLPEGLRADAWCAVAGDGPLQEELREAGRAAGVRVLGALPFPDGVVDFCRAVDISVVPSYAEGEIDDQSPRTVIEALLSGAFVVGSDSGGIPAMLDGRGILVPERDPEGLARGLAAALERLREPDAAERLQQASVARGMEQYSTAAVADQMADLWRRCLRSGPRRRKR